VANRTAALIAASLVGRVAETELDPRVDALMDRVVDLREGG